MPILRLFTLQRGLRRLGCKHTGYNHYFYEARTITNRFKEYRNKPYNGDQDEQRLLSALNEEPPPSFLR